METENHEAASVLKELLKMCITCSSDFLLWKLGTRLWVFQQCYNTMPNYCENRGISHWKALSGHVKNSFWRAVSSTCAEVCYLAGELGHWQVAGQETPAQCLQMRRYLSSSCPAAPAVQRHHDSLGEPCVIPQMKYNLFGNPLEPSDAKREQKKH